MSSINFFQLVGALLGVLILSVSGQDLADIACSPDTQPAVLTNYSGALTSPNFPQNYPDNTTCQWLIVSQEPGGWVKLDFTNFYTEATFDIVLAYDGNNKNAPIIGGFEGLYDPAPYDIVSTQQFLLLTFTSDAFTNRLGFSATYTSTAPYQVIDACVPSSRPLFLTDYSGTITSKNYPGNYWNYQWCQWTIESQEPSGTVTLKFNRFFTDASNDFVYVYDGPTATSTLLARMSGPRDQPVTYQSSQQYLTVVFTSNQVLTRYGFTADYTSVPAVKN